MKLDTITMEKEAAEQAFAEYRDAVRSEKRGTLNEVRREYEALDRAIMRGYKEIAKGRTPLKLSEAIRAGGTITKTWDASYWQRDKGTIKRTGIGTFPRLAVTRADARFCFCSGIDSNGHVRFGADDQWPRRRADQLNVDVFTLPEHALMRRPRARG